MAEPTIPPMMPSVALKTDYNQKTQNGKVVMPQASEEKNPNLQKSSSSSSSPPPVEASDLPSVSGPHEGTVQTPSSPGVRTQTDMQRSSSCIVQHVPTEQISCNWRVPPKKRVEIDAESKVETALKGTKFGTFFFCSGLET